VRVLINAVFAKSGGAETYMRNLIRDLPKQLPDSEYILYVPNALASSLINCGKAVQIVGINIGYKSALRRFLWDQIDLRRVVRDENIDILFSSSDFGMFFPPCKQVLFIRNALFFSDIYKKQFLPRKRFRVKLKFWIQKALIWYSARFSDVVMTASETMRDAVQHSRMFSAKRTAVNHLGVPLDKFQRETGNFTNAGSERTAHSGAIKPVRIAYVSEYGDYKNLTTLLYAIKTIVNSDHGRFFFTLTVDPSELHQAGSITLEEDQCLLVDPQIASCVHTIGAVPYDSIESIYKRSDIFVFPSLVESFGHPLAEAMASGLPVIASDIPIHREICGDSAIYFDPLDVDGFAKQILRLCEDRALRSELGRRGMDRAHRKFDWENHVDRLAHLFREMQYSQSARHVHRYSYDREKAYYGKRWPEEAQPYEHLEPYIRCWMNPEEMFSGKRVLDIGAGEATYTRLIAERFSPDAVVACDLFPKRMLPAARANKNRCLQFVAGDCHRLPFQDDAFDVIFGSLILHQIPELEDLVGEIHRILVKDGCYVGIEINPFHPIHIVRYLFARHSANQYLLSKKHLVVFKNFGFNVQVQYFYGRFPWIRNRLMTTTMGITARKRISPRD